MIIWIASYPRSGNTFLRVILNSVFGLETYSIYDDRFDIGKDEATSDVVGHKMLPDDFDLEAARAGSELFLMKTHDYVDNPDDRVIYLVRDGRQSSVSYRHYINSFVGEGCELRDVLYGNVHFGTWAEHVAKWDPARRENTLFLKFEDLVSSPHSFLEEISRFIGVEIKTESIPGFEELHEINPKFFRKGKADSWKQELTAAENDLFWSNSYAQMVEIYPDEPRPELYEDSARAERFSALFVEQGKYFRTTLERVRDDLDEQKQLAGSLRGKIAGLEAELDNIRQSLAGVRSAIRELSNIKALKAPLSKYRQYKTVLDYFSK